MPHPKLINMEQRFRTLLGGLKTLYQGSSFSLSFYKGRGTLTDIEALSRGGMGRNAPLDFRVQDEAANRDKRSFDLSNPKQLITPLSADIMERSIGYAASLNPTTSRLISMGKRGRSLLILELPVKEGGVSPAKIQERN